MEAGNQLSYCCLLVNLQPFLSSFYCPATNSDDWKLKHQIRLDPPYLCLRYTYSTRKTRYYVISGSKLLNMCQPQQGLCHSLVTAVPHWEENKTQPQNPPVTKTHNYLSAMQGNLLSHYLATFKSRTQLKNRLSRYMNDEVIMYFTAEHQTRPPRAQEKAEYIMQVKGTISTRSERQGNTARRPLQKATKSPS